MAISAPPAPVRDPIASRGNGLITDPWIEYFTSRQGAIDSVPARLRVVSSEGHEASIGTTALSTGSLSAGLYRVWYRLRVTQPATTSSSVTVTLASTESGVPLSETSAAMTGNTTGTVASGVWLVRVDAGTPIFYSTTYASAGATPMQYRVDVVLESVPV